MKTMVIYDNNGKIFASQGGSYEVPSGGVQYLEVEHDVDQIITGINVSDPNNHVAILENIEHGVSNEDLQKQIQLLNEAVMELSAELYSE